MDADLKFSILLAVASADFVLLTCLSSRRGRISRAKHGRLFLWAASALYLPLITYILTYLTKDLSSMVDDSRTRAEDDTYNDLLDRLIRWLFVVMLTVLVQSLKSHTDMAALAVAAVVSPAAGADDVDSQKIRPSMDSLVQSLWVLGLVIYTMLVLYSSRNMKRADMLFPTQTLLVLFLFWALGAGRMALTFAAFRHASGSFALGRNAQLIAGYMAQLQEGGSMDQGAVPRLILTGERREDVEESPQGYRVKASALESSRLVTLHKVWSSEDHRLSPELKDLCLSFCLFKCLRRRFAGHRLAEAGSTWAFRFVSDGLLRREDESDEDDHERIFRVISDELSFASDFYYSPLPVASLGPWSASLYFILSLLICATLSGISIFFNIILWWVFDIAAAQELNDLPIFPIALTFLSAVGASIEIWAMVSSVRSNWTKISMVACCISRSRWSRMISSCLLKCKSAKHWKDVIGQNLLIDPSPAPDQLFKRIFLPKREHIEVSSDVKAAVIRSLRSLRSGRHLSNGIATVQRLCPHLSWACHGCVSTSTEAILVWHIATSIFEIKYPASSDIANNLSQYCAYLVANAPDLLPDNAAWTKHQYQQVKKCVVTFLFGTTSSTTLYAKLDEFESVGDESSPGARVVKIGFRLGKQLVEEVEAPRLEDQAENQEESATRRREEVWEFLAEFWSDMILYLAPSDNVKGHIEALQRGGELITLLWALLLHAGITTRPAAPDVFQP